MPCEFSKPAGLITPPTEAETLDDDVHRLPVDLGELLDRLGGEFRRGDAEMKTSAPEAFSLTMWSSMVGSEVS